MSQNNQDDHKNGVNPVIAGAVGAAVGAAAGIAATVLSDPKKREELAQTATDLVEAGKEKLAELQDQAEEMVDKAKTAAVDKLEELNQKLG